MTSNSNTKVLAVGCSMTFGYGLKLEKYDPSLWVNQLFPNMKINNVASPGANNHWIFLETLSQLRQQSYDIVLVAWSGIPRYNFHVGLELSSVRTLLTNKDVILNSNRVIPGSWLKSIGDNLNKIHNDHWDLLDMVKYVNTLIDLQVKIRQGKLVFVNTLGPWCNNYFKQQKINLPSDLDPYVQSLLEVDRRDDKDIFQLYDMMHAHYTEYGGIQENYWLNLYNSLRRQQIDNASSTDEHPGYQSQQAYTTYLAPVLYEKLNENSNNSY